MAEAVAARQPAVALRANPDRVAGHPDRQRAPLATGIDRLQRSLGNRGMAQFLRAGGVQPKLTVGPVDDEYEREADRVADEVMRMPDPAAVTAQRSTLRVQRMCSECTEKKEEKEEIQRAPVGVQRTCAACDEEERRGTIQAKRSGVHESSGTEAPTVVGEALRSAGERLDAPTRAFFEPRFGRDFSQVRVHADDRAAKSAQSIGALAYAAGPHIVFAEGQYSPRGDRGRHLLAHELAHTVQQGHARIQRDVEAISQGDVGLGDRPEEFENKESSPSEVAGPIQMMVQRSATWKGATVHETVSPARTPFGGAEPISWHLLNGTKLETTANADSAIKVPGVTATPVPSTDPASTWKAKVATVPGQEGSADETVLRPGPWSTVVTKAQAGVVTGLAACSGAGNSTFTRHGNPSDDSVYKANRRHENRHVADHKDAFDDAIGKWDKNLQDAKNNGTEFAGASAAGATAALWAAMGNTPKDAARSYRSQGFAKGQAFHGTADGGPMVRSNPVSNANCSTSAMDVTNPMP